MAIYFLDIKVFGRNRGVQGSVSTSAAAYRSGERIQDERTGAVYDHSRRRDVMHKQILLPSQYERAGVEIDWARDRSRLWNAAEQAEKQRNSRVAREYLVALPHELQEEQRLVLAQSFAQTLSDRYGNAVDLAVHAPRSDPRNFHAHLLTTTRQITPNGLGEKTSIEWSGTRRHEQGLPRSNQDYRDVRETWSGLANYALREAGLQQRISHVRDPTNQPRQREQVWLPRIAYEIEKRGGHSFVGDRVRRQFQEQRQAGLDAEKVYAPTREEQAAQAVHNWRVWRDRQKQGLEAPSQERTQERTQDRSHGRDEGYGL